MVSGKGGVSYSCRGIQGKTTSAVTAHVITSRALARVLPAHFTSSLKFFEPDIAGSGAVVYGPEFQQGELGFGGSFLNHYLQSTLREGCNSGTAIHHGISCTKACSPRVLQKQLLPFPVSVADALRWTTLRKTNMAPEKGPLPEDSSL